MPGLGTEGICIPAHLSTGRGFLWSLGRCRSSLDIYVAGSRCRHRHSRDPVPGWVSYRNLEGDTEDLSIIAEGEAIEMNYPKRLIEVDLPPWSELSRTFGRERGESAE